MARQFKVARKMRNITIKAAAEHLGISQSTLVSWENGARTPNIDSVIMMAEYYGFTTDYLLGLSPMVEREIKLESVQSDLLVFLDNRPVFIENFGWGFVDRETEHLRLSNGQSIPISDAPRCSVQPAPYTYTEHPAGNLLSYEDLAEQSRVWVEPISTDETLRNELRGWYHVKQRYVENELGQRFYFDTYNAKWVAFATK